MLCRSPLTRRNSTQIFSSFGSRWRPSLSTILLVIRSLTATSTFTAIYRVLFTSPATEPSYLLTLLTQGYTQMTESTNLDAVILLQQMITHTQCSQIVTCYSSLQLRCLSIVVRPRGIYTPISPIPFTNLVIRLNPDSNTGTRIHQIHCTMNLAPQLHKIPSSS